MEAEFHEIENKTSQSDTLVHVASGIELETSGMQVQIPRWEEGLSLGQPDPAA